MKYFKVRHLKEFPSAKIIDCISSTFTNTSKGGGYFNQVLVKYHLRKFI